MVVPTIIEEEEEEEDVGVPFVRRKLNTYVVVQESVVEPIFSSAHLLASTMLEQEEKHPETSDAMVEETADVGINLETTAVQVAEVIAGLKYDEVEAYGIPEEVVSKAKI